MQLCRKPAKYTGTVIAPVFIVLKRTHSNAFFDRIYSELSRHITFCFSIDVLDILDSSAKGISSVPLKADPEYGSDG
jgi:hypothetical protein